jgi:hypothetical protein
VHIDAALNRLRVAGYPVHDEDVARLSPFTQAIARAKPYRCTLTIQSSAFALIEGVHAPPNPR